MCCLQSELLLILKETEDVAIKSLNQQNSYCRWHSDHVLCGRLQQNFECLTILRKVAALAELRE